MISPFGSETPIEVQSCFFALIAAVCWEPRFIKRHQNRPVEDHDSPATVQLFAFPLVWIRF